MEIYMNTPGRIFTVILTILLLVLFPLQYIARSNDKNFDQIVESKLQRLSDEIRQSGRLTLDQYEELVSYLDATNTSYEIMFEDAHPVTGEELDAQSSDILLTRYKMNSYGGVKRTAMVSTSSSHIHTSDCYAAHRHGEDYYTYETHSHSNDCIVHGDTKVKFDIYIKYTNEYHFGTGKIADEYGHVAQSISGTNGYFIRVTCHDCGNLLFQSEIIGGIGGPPRYTFEGPSDLLYQSVYPYYEDIDLEPYQQFENSVLSMVASDKWTIQKDTYTNYESDYAYTEDKCYIKDTILMNVELPSFTKFPYTEEYKGCTSSECLSNCNDAVYSCGYEEGQQIPIIHKCTEYHVEDNPIVNISYEIANGSISYEMSGGPINWSNCTVSCSKCGKVLLDYKSNIDYFTMKTMYPSSAISSTSYPTSYYLDKEAENVGSTTSSMWESYLVSLTPTTVIQNGSLKDYYKSLNPNNNGNYSGTYKHVIYSDVKLTLHSLLYSSEFISCSCGNGFGSHVEYSCGLSQDETPICNQVVMNLNATNPTQTVEAGDEIITTATARMLDGSEQIIECTPLDYDPNIEGTQNVTLEYSGYVETAKKVGTVTCQTVVMVTSTDPLQAIQILNQPISVIKYTNEEDIPIEIKAFYESGKSEIVTSGYRLEGYQPDQVGEQEVLVHYSQGSIKVEEPVTIVVKPLTKECLQCHQMYELDTDDSDQGCPFCKNEVIGLKVAPEEVIVSQGDDLPITVFVEYKDNEVREVYNWTSDYDPERLGIHEVTIEYVGYAQTVTVTTIEKMVVCPICQNEYRAFITECPFCKNKLIGIQAFPGEVTVHENEPIDITVTATYADGESTFVTGWSIDTGTEVAGNYEATISYEGVTTQILLHVLSDHAIECPICHTYYEKNETTFGCPNCYKTLAGIEAYLDGETNILQRGTEPSIQVIGVYLDGHGELIPEDYQMIGFDKDVLGPQTITISYQGFCCYLDVVVMSEEKSRVCPNGHVYKLNEDGSDPGCPYCDIVEKKRSIHYVDITFSDEIIDTLYETGVYTFQSENYLTIRISKKSNHFLYKLRGFILRTACMGYKKFFVFGGEIT